MIARGRERRLDDLALHLKGLVHVRALLEAGGASPGEIAAHSDAIDRVRAELAQLTPADATSRGDG